jgi:4a-hydroxytetrahydrobiopterin dehydratase
MTDPVSITEFHASGGLEDWRVLSDGALAFYRTGSFAESAALIHAVAGIAGLAEHPPAVDIRAGGVTFRLVSVNDDHFGMTGLDVEMGREISRVARGLGLVADPSVLQNLLIVPGAPEVAAVVPFWRAALGYDPRPDSPDEDLVDPSDRGPAFWFEGMQEPRPGGGGAIHLAVWVPQEEAEARLRAALAAGGHMVRDDFAPSWWTLADAAGNEVDIATTAHRD